MGRVRWVERTFLVMGATGETRGGDRHRDRFEECGNTDELSMFAGLERTMT